ncbi:hypothetical protein D3C71_2165450 [compost metagenome]
MQQVHGHVAAQGEKTAVHLCTGRACLGPGGHIVGPEIGLGKLFSQVFGNRQGIGDHAELGLE